MLDPIRFSLFLHAAILLVVTPGLGIFYVLARSIAGRTCEGILSALGTFCGGLAYVIAVHSASPLFWLTIDFMSLEASYPGYGP